MALQVEIEKHSGFCGGVIRAIGKAEEFLEANPSCKLYSLGAIVHNEAELARLEAKGLVTVGKEDLMNIPPSETVLIRAHGEPPETYELARQAGLTIIDCTCPVVLRLQKNISETYSAFRRAGRDSVERLASLGPTVRSASLHSGPPSYSAEGGMVPGVPSCSPEGTTSGQVIIFGKIGHAEVLGLLGQVGGDAIVIEDYQMLMDALQDGRINLERPLEIFSQTTKSPVEYSRICTELSSRARAGLVVHQTICSQVASRHEELAGFATSHDVIIFVSGASSSNGKVLFDLCKSRNPRTYHISGPEDIQPSWFAPDERVGICGATSTPRWLLDQVAHAITALHP